MIKKTGSPQGALRSADLPSAFFSNGCEKERHRSLPWWSLILSLLLVVMRGHASDAQLPYSIAPLPDWVADIAVPALDEAPRKDVNLGEYFTLIDEQTDVSRSEKFYHYAKVILSEAGVQNGAQLRFNFDPSYESLTIHSLRIVRGTNVLNRLDASKIKVIQKEDDLERHIYNGTLSTLVFLEDVRIGDRIEYAFTLRGLNPILKGHFLGMTLMQWQVPVQKRVYRVICPDSRNVAFNLRGGAPSPSIHEADGIKEYVWSLDHLSALAEDDQVPGWFSPYPWIEMSEFADWGEVARWAADLYKTKEVLSPELAEKVSKWREETSPENRMMAAVQFLQAEVRYLGIEFGPFSHQPTDPSVVFARRFGDCKDKALLLCTILNAMDIKACPALVNTTSRETINDWLPSPFAFNHVVVRVEINDNIYWLDPTRSYQRGPMSSRFFPDYKYALLLRPGTTSLSTIPFSRNGWPKTTLREQFFFSAYDKPVELRVTATAEGLDAERLRGWLAEISRDTLDKRYLNYYAAMYPGIESMHSVEIHDNPDENTIETVELYRIKDAWSLTGDKQRWHCVFYPQSLRDLIKKPATTVRKMPLGLIYPQHQITQTELMLPKPWPAKSETMLVEDAYARLKFQVTALNQQIHLKYDFETLADSVPVAETLEHARTLDRMKDSMGYEIFRFNGADRRPGIDLNWSLLMLMGMFSLLLLVGAVFLVWHRPIPAGPPPLPGNPNLTGLGGWLILVGLGLCCGPLVIGHMLLRFGPYFSGPTWPALTSPGAVSYNPWWAPLLIFEMFAAITRMVLCILLIIFFFQRRAIFPRLYIIFSLLTVVVIILDQVGMGLLDLPNTNISAKTSAAIPGIIFGSILWSLYMLKSVRVKLTFVK